MRAQEEGDAILAGLPDLGPNASWSVTNLGGGWLAVLTVITSFRGATGDELLANVIAGEPEHDADAA
jgi:hypothetical protein